MTVRFVGSASEVPAGLRLVVTGISFDPAVTMGGNGCGGSRIWCLDGPVLTESSSDECFVRVVGSPDGDTTATVQVAARVDCPPGRRADCLAFEQRLVADGQSVGPRTVVVPAASAPAPDSSTDSSTDSSPGSSTDSSPDASSS